MGVMDPDFDYPSDHEAMRRAMADAMKNETGRSKRAIDVGGGNAQWIRQMAEMRVTLLRAELEKMAGYQEELVQLEKMLEALK